MLYTARKTWVGIGSKSQGIEDGISQLDQIISIASPNE